MNKNDSCFLAFAITAFFLFLIIPLEVHNANAATPQLTFGSLGAGPGQLHLPRSIAVDSSGNIYVADNRNHRVEKFDSSGTYLSSLDTSSIPEGIAFDSSGNIYVVDRNSSSIEKFSPAGTLLSSFGSAGSAAGQLGNPERIAIDSTGNIYVTDSNVIQKFNSKGISISQFFANDTPQCCLNAIGIAIDSSNNVYVADVFYNRILKFNSSGSILLSFNSTLSKQRALSPQDVAVDAIGDIYVADTGNGRIVKFNPAGFPISSLDISGVPVGIAIDKSGKIYVTDLGNNRVDVFTTSQLDNNTSIPSTMPQKKEIPLNQNSTALAMAIKLATSSPQFQSLVKGYNYTFSSDFEESGPLSQGGIGLTAHGFAFELYQGPVEPGKAVKVVEVLEDPALAKILNVTSYQAEYHGPARSSTTSTNPPVPHAQNNTMLSPLKQFKSGILAKDVICKQGFQLILKSEDGSPTCVKPQTVEKLIERGWTFAITTPSENKPHEISHPTNQTIQTAQIIPSCVSKISHQYAIAGPPGFPLCPVMNFQASGNILNATGFYGIYNYTKFPNTQNFVLEPGHIGTFAYKISTGSIYSWTNAPPANEINITNNLSFMHDAGMNNHPGVIVSVFPNSEMMLKNSSALVTITFSASKDALLGTYWVTLPPGVCAGGEMIILTITDCGK